MADNRDIAVLAKKVYELSVLPLAELDARKWEALLILQGVYASATPEGIEQALADKESRWRAKIDEEGQLATFHPKWNLRTDDGKPPAVRFAIASALVNPNRTLQARHDALQRIPPADREPLTDLARALNLAAWDGATGDARLRFSQKMREVSKTWTKDPWLTIDHQGNEVPISILIKNQGITNDGSMWDDDPSDDTPEASWNRAIHKWDIDFLRDNSFAQLFTTVGNAAGSAIDTAGELADGANLAAKRLAKLIAWLPYIVGGIGVVGATAFVVKTVNRRPAQPAPQPAPEGPTQHISNERFATLHRSAAQ